MSAAPAELPADPSPAVSPVLGPVAFDLDSTILAQTAPSSPTRDILAATLPANHAQAEQRREAPTPSAAFAAALAAAAEPEVAGPSYRTNARLFDEFRSSRMKAAAGSLQQRFASSIHQLNQFEDYQRSKTSGLEEEAKRADERAAARQREKGPSLEQSVMRPRSAVATAQISGRVQSNTQAAAIVSSPRRSPSRGHSQPSLFHTMQLPPAALTRMQEEKEEKHRNTAAAAAVGHAQPRSPVHHHAPATHAAAASSSTAAVNPSGVDDSSSSRLRHLEKAFDMSAAGASSSTRERSFPIASASTRPIVPLASASPRRAAIPLPISRPISLTARASPRTSPRASPQGMSRGRERKKKEALPSHVARLMEIQSAHAARLGAALSDDSDESDEEDEPAAFTRRRTQNRVPVIPTATPSPKMNRFKPNAMSTDEPPPASSPAFTSSSSRIPISQLAASMLAEDQREEAKAFLHRQPRPSYSPLPLQTYQSLPKSSYSVPNSNVHIHMHSPPFSQHRQQPQFDAPVAPPPLPVFEAPSLPIHSQPIGSPRMRAQHPPTWEQHAQQQRLHMQQMQLDQTHRQVDELYQQTLAHRAHADVEADAEFEALQSLLQGEGRASESQAARLPSHSSLHSRQSIDNYHYPPHLFDQSASDSIVTTMLEHSPPQRRSTHAAAAAAAEPFQYTQQLYHPSASHFPSAGPAPPGSSSWAHPLDGAARASAAPSLHTRLHTPYAADNGHSVPAHSFFQPNMNAAAASSSHGMMASQNELQRYPPVLRQQLQQHMSEHGIPIVALAPSPSFSHLPPGSSSPSRARSRASSPMSPKSSHTADVSLMSPSRLGAYLQHYLAHRTQVLPSSTDPGHSSLFSGSGEFVPDPSKVALTESEADQLRHVIVELNSIRSAHELSAARQQVVTRLRPAPAASAPSRSPTNSPQQLRRTLTPGKLRKAAAAKKTTSQPQHPVGFPVRKQAPVGVARPDRHARTLRHEALADQRQRVRSQQVDARLTAAFGQIAHDKATQLKKSQQHAHKLKTFPSEQPKTLDTGLGDAAHSSDDEEWRNSLHRHRMT